MGFYTNESTEADLCEFHTMIVRAAESIQNNEHVNETRFVSGCLVFAISGIQIKSSKTTQHTQTVLNTIAINTRKSNVASESHILYYSIVQHTLCTTWHASINVPRHHVVSDLAVFVTIRAINA